MSSLPQFKEILAIKLEDRMQDYTTHLVEQMGADLPTLRGYQGRIAGFREALELLNDTFKQMF